MPRRSARIGAGSWPAGRVLGGDVRPGLGPGSCVRARAGERRAWASDGRRRGVALGGRLRRFELLAEAAVDGESGARRERRVEGEEEHGARDLLRRAVTLHGRDLVTELLE